MEKTEITSLDLKFLVKELRENLTGGMFRKIYQYGGKTKQFLFEIFVPTRGAFWLYVDNQKMFLTKRKKAIPKEPPSFCMFLRKHLMGKKILDVKQHDFDRVIEISTAESVLIFELLSPGNVILCDTSYKVIMPLQVQRWRDRDIRPKNPYKYPPKPPNPFELDLDSLKRSLAMAEKKTIAYLAKNLGFGSVYASEICSRAGIDEGKLTSDLSFNDILKLHEVIASIGGEKPEPRIYDETVSPFPMEIFEGKESKSFGSFSEALDEFFSGQEIEIAKEKVKEVVGEKKEKVERIVERQEEALEKWERIEKDSRDCAERIYNNYSTVEGVLSGIRKAKDSGLSWDEIKQRIKSEGTPEAEAIKEIRENDGVVILDLGGKDVLIDIRKSPEENAKKYYEDAKWAKKKFGGTEEARGEYEGKLERAEKEVLEQEQRDFSKEVFPVEKKEHEEEPKLIEENETGWKETVMETPLEAKPKRVRRKWFVPGRGWEECKSERDADKETHRGQGYGFSCRHPGSCIRDHKVRGA
jgi:predicted ribosome quality control (RQC) complex YloA/Tae2 family protein